MKKLTLLLALTILVISPTQAQDRMTEGDILGSWKMVIDLDEVLEELEEEADESETLLAQVLLESVSGIIEGVMDNIDIYMDFDRGGEATIFVQAFDEADDDEARQNDPYRNQPPVPAERQCRPHIPGIGFALPFWTRPATFVAHGYQANGSLGGDSTVGVISLNS